MHTTSIEPLPMPRHDVPLANAGNYRVYSDDRNFKLVHAASALEALKLSGLDSARKVLRDSIDLTAVFSLGDWSFDKPAPIDAAAAGEAPAATTESSAKETVEVPLSGDEVGKLLNNP